MSWWYVLNVAKPWLYGFAEQIIVWRSNGASRVTVGAATAPYAVVGMVEEVQRAAMSF